MPVAMTNWDSYDYFQTGVEYYLSGRQAVIWGHATAGSLLHHAMEMLLKAGLRDSLTPKELKTKYRHGLTALWPDVKAKAGDSRLDAFDDLVKQIDAWEEIRYLDMDIRKSSVTMAFGIYRGKSGATPKGNHYELALEDFDEFFQTLTAVYPVNPVVIRDDWIGKALPVYEQDNKHRI